MRTIFIALLLLGYLGTATSQGQYTISTGDAVDIQVFGESELSMTVRVRENGMIPYPFLGDLRVSGKSVDEVQSMIMAGLKGPYLLDPSISVVIAEYRPFYVNGQVKSAGGFGWEPGLTVRKAISLAGGLTERASTRKIYLQPEGQAEDNRVRVDLDSPVRPGDVVTVAESFF